MAPMRRAIVKCLMESPPRRARASSMKMMVSELLRERVIVSVMARFESAYRLEVVLFLSSRIRSKMTMVS